MRSFKHTGLTAGRRYWYQVGRGKNVDMIGREVLSFVFGRFFLVCSGFLVCFFSFPSVWKHDTTEINSHVDNEFIHNFCS